MEERTVKYRLGTVSSIEAETFGAPGHRTFRLVLVSGRARSDVWMEKEQLLQLGVYLQEALRGFSEEQRSQESQPKEPSWSGEETSIEFKALQIFLNHDSASNSFFFQAFEEEAGAANDEPSSVSFWITTDQAGAVAQEALRICAAGRPPCFLCGMPINAEGHVCPRANGHAVMESG